MQVGRPTIGTQLGWGGVVSPSSPRAVQHGGAIERAGERQGIVLTAPSRQVRFTAAIAGQLAGIAMLLCMAVAYRHEAGVPWLFPLQLLAALVLGPEALARSDVQTLEVGFLAHQLGPTVVWARLYGLLLGFRSSPSPLALALAAGFGVGAVALALDAYLLLPPVLRMMHGANVWAENVPRSIAWIAHGVYGGTLGCAFWWLARR